MSMKQLLTVTLVLASFAAHGQGQVVSQAYELDLSNFRAPTTANSSAAFKQCDECDQQRVRVTESTSYSVNGKRVRLDDFRKAVSQSRDRDRDGKTVILLHHLESDTVVSIDVSL